MLVDADYLLLVDHINAELWLPTGGHVEPGEHPKLTVIREAQEELGIDPVFRDGKPIFLTESVTVGRTAGHTDVSLWYVIDAKRDAKLMFDRNEFRDARWFRRDTIPLERTDQHMARFLRKLYAT